mmetsp:Transcript_79192/g.169628  ORF Transcript_79192/g.169628 Transcript_79192/m.169628 type:complete len:413 (+) Transcript_79192:1691-2929(+)
MLLHSRIASLRLRRGLRPLRPRWSACGSCPVGRRPPSWQPKQRRRRIAWQPRPLQRSAWWRSDGQPPRLCVRPQPRPIHSGKRVRRPLRAVQRWSRSWRPLWRSCASAPWRWTKPRPRSGLCVPRLRTGRRSSRPASSNSWKFAGRLTLPRPSACSARRPKSAGRVRRLCAEQLRPGPLRWRPWRGLLPRRRRAGSTRSGPWRRSMRLRKTSCTKTSRPACVPAARASRRAWPSRMPRPRLSARSCAVSSAKQRRRLRGRRPRGSRSRRSLCVRLGKPAPCSSVDWRLPLRPRAAWRVRSRRCSRRSTTSWPSASLPGKAAQKTCAISWSRSAALRSSRKLCGTVRPRSMASVESSRTVTRRTGSSAPRTCGAASALRAQGVASVVWCRHCRGRSWATRRPSPSGRSAAAKR